MEVSDLPALTPASPPPTAAAPASSPSGPATASPSTASAPAPGFWVQLGAFREREGADGLQAQAGRALPALTAQLRVFSENGTHRLQAGPYASREAANDTATQLRNGLRLAPIVVERR
jgi:rare lipoprotein A